MSIKGALNPNRQRPTVKPEALSKMLMGGHPLLVGEYRGTSTEKIPYNDKATGKATSFIKIAHIVELTHDGAVEAITVSERGPNDLDDPAKFVSGLKKGATVVLRLDGMQRVKGRIEASVSADDDAICVLS